DQIEDRGDLLIGALHRFDRLEGVELEGTPLLSKDGHQDVLTYGELVEQRVDLIALAHAALAHLGDADAGDVLVAQVYAAMRGLDFTRQHAEERGFSSPVRPDEAAQFAFVDG